MKIRNIETCSQDSMHFILNHVETRAVPRGAKEHAPERSLVLVLLGAQRQDPWGEKDVCSRSVVIQAIVMSRQPKYWTVFLAKFDDIMMRKKGWMFRGSLKTSNPKSKCWRFLSLKISPNSRFYLLEPAKYLWLYHQGWKFQSRKKGIISCTYCW